MALERPVVLLREDGLHLVVLVGVGGLEGILGSLVVLATLRDLPLRLDSGLLSGRGGGLALPSCHLQSRRGQNTVRNGDGEQTVMGMVRGG